MPISTQTLIWLFPIVFMFHDFEELILFEPWLKKNADEIRKRIQGRVPDFVTRQIEAVLVKSTIEFALPISMIFALTALAAFLAAQYQHYGFFLFASGAFFLHGFMHVGQAILLRKYVPALISSVLIVIPYGLVLFPRMFAEGLIDWSSLLLYFAFGMALIVPFILVMHKVGEAFYGKVLKFLLR